MAWYRLNRRSYAHNRLLGTERVAVFEQILAVVFVAGVLLFGFACRSPAPTPRPLSYGVFTPDSAAIVFSVTRDDTCFLVRADISRGTAQRLTKGASGCEFDPVFSPDGKQMAFMRAPRVGTRAALIIARSDGTAQRELVPADADNLGPVFLPHSNQILFLRSGTFAHRSPLVDNGRHKFDLFSSDLRTGVVTQLTHSQFYDVSHLSVSADAKKILVSAFDSGGGVFLEIATATPGLPSVRLQPRVQNAPDPPAVYNAVWHPDSLAILFLSAAKPIDGGGFNFNIYRLSVSSGAIEQLTHLTGVIDGFSISPDAREAVLLRNGVYSVLNLETRSLTEIVFKTPL